MMEIVIKNKIKNVKKCDNKICMRQFSYYLGSHQCYNQYLIIGMIRFIYSNYISNLKNKNSLLNIVFILIEVLLFNI